MAYRDGIKSKETRQGIITNRLVSTTAPLPLPQRRSRRLRGQKPLSPSRRQVEEEWSGASPTPPSGGLPLSGVPPSPHTSRQYRGLLCCVKMQVMPRVNYPAMCYCNTHTRSSLSCLLAFYTIPICHIFEFEEFFYLLVSFLFFLHNCAQVLVQKCIRFCGKRTQHRQVIDINNFTTL